MSHRALTSRAKIYFSAALFSLLSANLSYADCYVTWNCGSSGQCAQLYGGYSGRRGPFPSCAGWVQRDQGSSCACGSASGGIGLPAGADPASELGKQIGNLIWQGLTAPAEPKTPEQIEAERQAQIQREQREAERQAKIQKYLDDETIKTQQKDASLDREAQDSLSLLGHKASAPPTMSDEELLRSNNDATAPSLCADELRALDSELNSFAAEAQNEGLKFTVEDALKTTRQSLKAAGSAAKDSGAGKLGMKQYADDYKILKAEVDKVKKEGDYIIEIKKCLDTKGCSLIQLGKRYDQEFKDWIKGLSAQGVHEASDRVDKAAKFYQGYTKRLEQHNENIINGAAKCISN